MAQIYVASSWRNPYYPDVVRALRSAGKRVIVYIPEMQEPELLYKLFDGVVGTLEDLTGCL